MTEKSILKMVLAHKVFLWISYFAMAIMALPQYSFGHEEMAKQYISIYEYVMWFPLFPMFLIFSVVIPYFVRYCIARADEVKGVVKLDIKQIKSTYSHIEGMNTNMKLVRRMLMYSYPMIMMGYVFMDISYLTVFIINAVLVEIFYEFFPRQLRKLATVYGK